MASSTKRTYRNVALLPPQTKVNIYVDVPPLFQNNSFVGNKERSYSEDFILRCFSQQMLLSGVKYDAAIWDPYFMNSHYEQALGTLLYEDKTLREMKSPENASYKKLESNLKWIADSLQSNISVFLGHIDTCYYYIDDVYKKAVEEIKMYSSLPTIFLIIGCRGSELAFRLNTESNYEIFRRHKIIFVGFEDLLHIHEGEIYSTKLFDTARSKTLCDSDEMITLFKTFNEELKREGVNKNAMQQKEIVYTPEEILDLYRTHPDMDIFRCCRAKLGRLYSDFVKGLERRKTTKYPKEHLVQKLKKLLEFLKTKQTIPREYITITSEDGLDCDKNDCQIPNLYEEQELLSQEYNKKGEFHEFLRELKSYIFPNFVYLNKSFNTEEERHQAVDDFYKRIQGLKGESRSVFTYDKTSFIPILFDFATPGLQFKSPTHSMFKIFRFILQKYGSDINLLLQNPKTKHSILHAIIDSANYSKEEEVILFKTIYDILPTEEEREKVFFLKDQFGYIPLGKGPEFRPLLCFFYIEKFGRKLKDVQYSTDQQGNLLHVVLENYITHENNENDLLLLNCVNGLLNVGVDPNQFLIETIPMVNKYKPLEFYTELYFPPYNTSLFEAFLRYGMTNDTKYFTNSLTYYKEIVENSNLRQKLLNVLFGLQTFLREFESDYRQTNNYQYGGMPRRYRYYSNNYNNDYYSENSYNYYHNEDRITSSYSKAEKLFFSKKKERYVNHTKLWDVFYTNISTFVNSFNKSLVDTILLYQKTLALRKGVKKHGSKVRRTYKLNKERLNKTIKNKLNTIQFGVNGEKMVGDLLGKIMELSKRKEFTKEEKGNYKKRPLAITKSELQLREKYDQLKAIYDQMQEILKTR